MLLLRALPLAGPLHWAPQLEVRPVALPRRLPVARVRLEVVRRPPRVREAVPHRH